MIRKQHGGIGLGWVILICVTAWILVAAGKPNPFPDDSPMAALPEKVQNVIHNTIEPFIGNSQ